MAETFPTPAEISEAAAEKLGGTTHERTQVAYLAKGVKPITSPTLTVQQNRIEDLIRNILAAMAAGMARKTGTLEVGAPPLRYRKSDETDVHFEGGTIALTASQTNYVYIDVATNALAKSTSSWPGDKTTFIPLGEFVCDDSDITTSDEDADRRGLSLYQIHASSSAPTGTTGTSFTLDSDNSGAGVDTQYRHNRGSDDAEDAASEWDETNDRFNFLTQHTTGTLAAVRRRCWSIGPTTPRGRLAGPRCSALSPTWPWRA